MSTDHCFRRSDNHWPSPKPLRHSFIWQRHQFLLPATLAAGNHRP
ncbi:hypothetical protein RBSWK_00600 [Rhodopirellula baltica SWK14]|uniref:Uncharacterized protein n=1 Tax=Rhodopirellula baltica SWK14 TaxID=993516 RepID=L7CPC6_RHOBT|nr:hypothetical protein RBSWK_00600 [Rhodopirellula baltica SWK14]